MIESEVHNSIKESFWHHTNIVTVKMEKSPQMYAVCRLWRFNGIVYCSKSDLQLVSTARAIMKPFHFYYVSVAFCLKKDNMPTLLSQMQVKYTHNELTFSLEIPFLWHIQIIYCEAKMPFSCTNKYA